VCGPAHCDNNCVAGQRCKEKKMECPADPTKGNKDECCKNFSCTDLTGCADGWERYGDKCYQQFSRTLRWNDAESFCQDEGGHLASVHSEAQNDFLFTISGFATWLGGHFVETEGKWTWSDGSTWDFSPAGFPCSTCPPTGDTQGPCTTFWHSASWNYATCSAGFWATKFVCQIDLGTTTTTTTTTTTGCPNGMVVFNQNCYKFVDTAKTWNEAEAVCQSQIWKGKGHLASIHSEEENNFVSSLSTERFWLGGNDLQKDGVWTWSDGSAITYNNWYPDNPSNTGGNEHCMEIYSPSEKKWNDNNCANKFKFVCKFTEGKIVNAENGGNTNATNGAPGAGSNLARVTGVVVIMNAWALAMR